MNVPYRPLDIAALVRNTSTAHHYAKQSKEAVDAMRKDARGEERAAVAECPFCFYLRRSRIGGAAMTTWHCGICAKEDVAGSTAVPKVCTPCAKEHHLCTNCGGDSEMRERRRNWPTAKPIERHTAEDTPNV